MGSPVDGFSMRKSAGLTFNDGIADVFNPAMDYDSGVSRTNDREAAANGPKAMIDVGSFPCGTCQGVSRRTFLRAGFAAPFALAIAGQGPLLAAEAPKAKSILLVWLGGGPSHLDLFDPKPKAPAEYRGPFTTIATRTPGVRFTELLPRLAVRSHKYSLIRSNVNFNDGHREAGSIALTGASAATAVYPPNFGSIVARQRGHDSLPRFISLARGPIGDGVGPIQGSGGGTWGRGHDPFLIGCTEKGQLEIPSLKLASGLTPGRLEDRRYLLSELDRVQRDADSGQYELWDNLRKRALALLTSPQGVAALDLSRESAATRSGRELRDLRHERRWIKPAQRYLAPRPRRLSHVAPRQSAIAIRFRSRRRVRPLSRPGALTLSERRMV